MNDFTKNMAQALFNQDKINDLLRKELQQAVNDLLKAELTAFLGYDPYARAGWNTGNSRNGAYFRKVDTQFGEIEIQVPRDRNGMFHQHTLPDYKQHSDVLESMIIKLYSKGVTTREIAIDHSRVCLLILTRVRSQFSVSSHHSLVTVIDEPFHILPVRTLERPELPSRWIVSESHTLRRGRADRVDSRVDAC